MACGRMILAVTSNTAQMLQAEADQAASEVADPISLQVRLYG